MSAAFDALVASTTPAFAVLAEVQPAEALGVFTKDTNPQLPQLASSGAVLTGNSGAAIGITTGDPLSPTSALAVTNGLLLCRLSASTSGAVSAITVTIGGVNYSLTKLTRVASGTLAIEYWYLLSPAASLASVAYAITVSAGTCSHEWTLWRNVNQSTPFGTPVSQTTLTTTPSLTPGSSTVQMVVDALILDVGRTAAQGGSQTADGTPVTTTLCASHKTGTGATTTMTWTLSGTSLVTQVYVAVSIIGDTLAYKVAWSQYAQTSVVAGGLYRRLDAVHQNATALSSVGSIAAVSNAPGSYYFDSANSLIYVSTSYGLSPDVYDFFGAWFTIFLSTSSVNFSDQPLYEPRISALPALHSAMPDPLFGAQESDTGQLAFSNTDGLFDILCRAWIWRNKKVTFKLGGSYGTTALAYSDYATMGSLRINKVEISDELAVLSLEDFGAILNRSLPPRTWGDGSPVGNITNTDIFGKSQPVVFGVCGECVLALGARNQGGGGAFTDYWYAYDILNNGAVSITNVVAVNRATFARTSLTLGDYTVLTPGNIVAVTNSTYTYDTYDIIATLTSASYQTFGQCAQQILFLCGEDVANVDSTAFSAADTAAPQLLGRLVDTPIQASDLMTELLQSVRGQVYRGLDGRWTCRVLDEGIPASYVSLDDNSFAAWTVAEDLPDLAAVLSEVRVRLQRLAYSGNWTETSSSDSAVTYANGTSDSHRIDTWLTSGIDGANLAQRQRFMRSAPSANVEFELRGLELMTACVGDLVAVTRARGPVARTGRLDGQFFRIIELTKSLGPDTPTVTGVLNDLDGQLDRIARGVADGSGLTWSNATAAQKAVYGFCCDANGYIDSTDAKTRNLKVCL